MKSGHGTAKGAQGKGPVKMAGGGSLLGAGVSTRSAMPRALSKSSSIKNVAGDRVRGAMRSAMSPALGAGRPASGTMPGKIMSPPPKPPSDMTLKKGGKVR